MHPSNSRPGLAKSSSIPKPSSSQTGDLLKVDFPLYAGYLEKWTNYVKGGWRRRYFVLFNGDLKYFIDRNSSSSHSRGSIHLKDVELSQDKYDQSRFTLQFDRGNQTLHLRAPSPKEKMNWVSAILQSRGLLVNMASHLESLERTTTNNPIDMMKELALQSTSYSIEMDKHFKTLQQSQSHGEEQAAFMEHATKLRWCLMKMSNNLQEVVNIVTAIQDKNVFLTETLQKATENDNEGYNEDKEDMQDPPSEYVPQRKLSNPLPPTTELVSSGSSQTSSSSLAPPGTKAKPSGQSQGQATRSSKHLRSPPRSLLPTGAVSNDDEEFFDVEDEVDSSAVDDSQPSSQNKPEPPIKEQEDLLSSDDDDTEDFSSPDEGTGPESKKKKKEKTVVVKKEKSLEAGPPPSAEPKEEVTVELTLANSLKQKRTRLPANQTTQKFSLWELVKEAVGKDITKITLPVILCEPLSFLQRFAEEFQYANLLESAAAASEPELKLLYVCAWATSAYSTTDERIGKPFNPVLGETYELVDRDGKFRFLSEQVSHHPPACAVHVESPTYNFWTDLVVNNKFWGKSLECLPIGTINLKYKTGEHFVWNKITTCVYNILFGTPYIDHYGQIEIKNLNGPETATVEFVKRGWWNDNAFEVRGEVRDKNGQVAYTIVGKWNDIVTATNTRTNKTFDVWKAEPRPPFYKQQYHFSNFSMWLNQLAEPGATTVPPNLMPAPSDARFRPDARALELGDLDLAGKEKTRVEIKQRAARTQREKSGQEWEPRWFEFVPQSTELSSGFWRYKGGYWESRHNMKYQNCPDLF
eukprot:TRINITY_DN214_c0_g1_i1.p1 TRINITY_DN214_c0_g1~~TRINITY_DN214_c0_g1_i1.p1  ORF type:complete len:807 (-),score=176.14 TRINITY_DN214_c0_g1_i1:77-2497(-)